MKIVKKEQIKIKKIIKSNKKVSNLPINTFHAKSS